MSKLEELTKELSKEAQNIKMQEVNKNFVEAQTKNSQLILDNLKNEIKEIQNKKLFLENDFNKEKEALLNALKSRENTLSAKEKEIEELRQELTREKNFVLEEKGKILANNTQLEVAKNRYVEKLNMLKVFLGEFSK